MDTTVMKHWLGEQRVILELPHRRLRVLYMENCNDHIEMNALQNSSMTIRTEIRYFPLIKPTSFTV